MASPGDKKEPANIVAQQAILVETILKEERHQKLFTNYSINPFRKMHTLTGKPNSFHDTAEGEEDSNFRAVIARANEVPVRKYVSPQTEAQEIGWMTQPLTDVDRTDRRLYFPKQSSAITRYMDAALKS
jgi:hypothetical protein